LRPIFFIKLKLAIITVNNRDLFQTSFFILYIKSDDKTVIIKFVKIIWQRKIWRN